MKNVIKILIFISVLFAIVMGILEFNAKAYKAVIKEVDNSDMVQAGIAKIGYQKIKLKIVNGKYKNLELKINNHLLGDMEFDEFYREKDKVLVSVIEKDGKIERGVLKGLYRIGWMKVLFFIFILLLVMYSKNTGIRAILSFVLTFLVIWKVMIPLFFYGVNPICVCIFVVMLISAEIIFLVAGISKKAVSAFMGTISGLLLAVLLTYIFGKVMNLFGMTEPFAQSLLFSGNFKLDMRAIFYSGIILGASGAAMDIAMDISASMAEIKLKKPDISKLELMKSGFNVGKTVIGTMTTTLLLAYSGSYITLLMLFYQKEISFENILNMKIIAAEVMRTLIGSIALVVVAPLTAIFAANIENINLPLGSDPFGKPKGSDPNGKLTNFIKRGILFFLSNITN